MIEGEPQQGNPVSAEDSPTFDDVVTLDPETTCIQQSRDELPGHDTELPSPEAMSAEERELHVQIGVSPSPQAMNSRPFTRLRSPSAREGGGKRQLTLTESVTKSTARQSEVTATARRKTKNTKEKNTS